MSTVRDDHGLRLAWGWVAHLRAGGTTPWLAWRETGAPGEPPVRAAAHALPGAQQLELLRVLNQRGTPGPVLAGRVLEASAPGRGRPDLELVGLGEPSGFGLPPVDPASLPRTELLRIATSLLADDIVAAGVPDERRRFRRPWRRRYRIVGDPWVAAAVRDDLARRGRPEGDHPAGVTLVLGGDVATMLADVWVTRACSDGVEEWEDFVQAFRRRRHLPPRADLLGQARWWAERIGAERVRVVLDPAQLPRLTGLRRKPAAPPRLSADAAELCRRLVPVLGVLALPHQRAELLRRQVAPRLAALDPVDRGGGRPLGVPERFWPWLERMAVRQRDGLLGDGYAVHGDPGLLLPPPAGTLLGTVPSIDGVFELALRLLIEGPARGGSRGRSGQ